MTGESLLHPSDVAPEPPIGGALYRHTARRGAWRIETVGRKWIKFRSTEIPSTHGRWLSFKEARGDWPNGWTRA